MERRSKVAVLGGTGFVGRNVSDALVEAGMEVRAFNRSGGCDLLDLPDASARILQFQPDYIVNCAAIVGSVNYVADFAADVVDVNMRMLLNVYQIAKQMRTAIVINPVANCAYPGVMDLYCEAELWDGPLHPSVLSYGSTRRMMLVLSECYARQFGVRSINLIVPNIYGPYDSTNPNKTHALNALVIKFVKAVKRRDDEVEIWGTGSPIREWLYVKDFATMVREVIARRLSIPEPINIAQKEGFTVVEIVQMISSSVGYAGRLRFNTQYPDGAPKKVMDDALFRRDFPEFQFTPLEAGIRETAAYYSAIL